MIQDITYQSSFLFFEAPQSGSATAITAYSYGGINYDATTTSISGSAGGETAGASGERQPENPRAAAARFPACDESG